MSAPILKNKNLIGNTYVKEVIGLIENAKNDIFILMFDWKWYKHDFSCDTSLINQALVRAIRRGVKIKAITTDPEIKEILTPLGFEIKIYEGGGLMHAKTLIFDQNFVVSGSHNLTENAMKRNLEISFVAENPENAKQLTDYFNSLWQ